MSVETESTFEKVLHTGEKVLWSGKIGTAIETKNIDRFVIKPCGNGNCSVCLGSAVVDTPIWKERRMTLKQLAGSKSAASGCIFCNLSQPEAEKVSNCLNSIL